MKIIINPGHSLECKPDSGAAYFGFKEALEAMEIAKYVKSKLDNLNLGLYVEICQQSGGNNNADTQLNNLVSYVNKSKADLFLSIHLNAATPAAKGSETLYFNGSEKGLKFAKCIQNSLRTINSIPDRGIKADVRGLAVLKKTNMTSCLAEVGFISNKAEAKFIHNNRELIAEKLTDGIINYLISQKLLTDNILITSNETKKIISLPKIALNPTKDNKYDCLINDNLKLKNNSLNTCLEWIKKNYI